MSCPPFSLKGPSGKKHRIEWSITNFFTPPLYLNTPVFLKGGFLSWKKGWPGEQGGIRILDGIQGEGLPGHRIKWPVIIAFPCLIICTTPFFPRKRAFRRKNHRVESLITNFFTPPLYLNTTFFSI
jgi:hypothetical protein